MFEDLHGRQLMLTDVLYQKPSKITNWSDYINIVYRDLITGEKHLLTIKDPTYVIYEVKEEFRTFRKARHHLPMEQCIPHEIKYKDRFKEIANIAGPSEQRYLREHTKENDRKELYKYPYVLGADIPIETYYMVLWEHELGNDRQKEPTKIFLDIEIDQMNWSGGGIPRHGECPIDAVSVVDESTNTVYQFLLHTKDNPLIDDFIKNVDDVHHRFHEMFDDSYGVLDYKIYMFDDELEMLRQIFRLIHTLKRDFCLIWNMDFDIPYIRDRIYALGEKAENVMCHSDFPTTSLMYFEDDRAFDFDKKRSYFTISSYTHYIDQLINYASMRKSQGAVRRVNLGAVGKTEIGDSKLDYTDIGNFIRFSRTDYVKYVLYNAKDTLLQMGIDRKCRDTFTFYNSCYYSYCLYKDGLKQTVSLRSFFYYEFLEDNIILGNNVNFGSTEEKFKIIEDEDDWGDDDDDDTFVGAIVGDPELNSHNGLILFGKRSMYLFGDAIDFDFSAMYPRSIVTFNIFASTMIGKLHIEHGEKYMRYDIDPGKEFIEDIITDSTIYTANKWFNLPNFDTLNRIISNKLEIEQVGKDVEDDLMKLIG